MRIAFSRSGGLAAAPGLQVRGSATLDPSGGDVTSEPDYHRNLDAAESMSLMNNAEAARAAAEELPTAGNPRARDAYQFSISIDTPQSGSATIRVQGDAAPTDPPAIARLVEWVSREADAIVQHRFTSG